MKKSTRSEAELLRQKAEELLKNKSPKPGSQLSDIEIQKLIHELEVHQVELEMQNDELTLAIERAESLSEKYIDLYTFAPIAYFTLSDAGKIIDLNLNGAKMLGKDRLHIKDKMFDLNISNNTKPVFNQFLSKLFSSHILETCEVTLTTSSGVPIYVSLTGIVTKERNQCLITAVDNTGRIREEEKLRISESNLNEIQIIANLGTYTFDIESDKWESSEMLDTIFGIDHSFNKSFESWASLIHPDWQKAMSDYFIQEVIGKKIKFDKEYKIIRHNDKAERWVHGTGKLTFNARNEPVMMVGSIRDITERKLMEESLHKKDKSFREAQRIAHIGSWEWVVETDTIFWSEELFRISGRDPRSLAPGFSELSSLYTLESWMLLKTSVSKALADGEPYNLELEMLRSDGSVRYTATKGLADYHTNGKIIGLHGTVQDITRQKEDENALKSIRRRALALLNAIPDMMFNLSSKGVYLDYKAAGEDLAYTANSIIGKNNHDIMPPEFADLVEEKINLTLQIGQMQVFEYQMSPSSDGISFFEARMVPNFPDEVIVIVRNITERKKATEDLIASEKRFRSIIDISPVPMALNNLQHQITFLNRAFVQTFGYTLDDIPTLDQWWSIAYPDPEYRQWVSDTWQDRLDTASSSGADFKPLEANIKCRDGNEKTVLATAALFHDKEEVIHLVVLYDISDRKRAEQEIEIKNVELQKINFEKDKFFSIIAHDLRSPFNGFLGFTKIMTEELSTLSLTELQRISRGMYKSATNLYSLLNNLLEWARMQQNATLFEPKHLILLPFVTSTLQPLLEIADKKGIELNIQIPATFNVLADENMLSSTIRNLVSNAVKFTSAGGKVSISAKATTIGTIEISVKDSGIGMDIEMLSNMFVLDKNIGRTGTDGEPSTGLGLMLCKDFIEKHGGKIWVTSEVNKGSAFYFSISGSSGQGNEEALQHAIPGSIKIPQVSNLKILIAEDDSASEMLISIMSQQFSSKILKVHTGIEAVESCRNNPDIDLVLMDIKMPFMDGYEATRQIRRFNANVAIIAQTANDSPEAREKAMQAGCNDYISKPIDSALLNKLIQKHCTQV